jgi:pyruvate dehydrogenase E2 component (dihydrolipoamide acetyltransferase)
LAIDVLPPDLGPDDAPLFLREWLVAEGDVVLGGDLLARIECRGEISDVPAPDDGTVGRILVSVGQRIPARRHPIAVLLAELDDESVLGERAGPAPAQSGANASASVTSTPLARRLADEAGIDAATLSGSGPHGRVVTRDVASALAAPGPSPHEATAPTYSEVPNSATRKIIAQRLSESKREIPHFYLTIDCAIDELLALRNKLNEHGSEAGGKLSVNDFVVRAVALALRRVPAANASWTNAAIRLHADVDVAVAVATPNGLITPIIRNADIKPLAAISREMKDLATRARAGRLLPEEYQGGGFTISNLGMFGIKEFSAIINPPQSCILAIGAAERRPIVRNETLAIATVMSCTLSVDHRSVDGAVGAQFLAAFKEIIEHPENPAFAG